ncbi:MAG: hypothetical protein LBU64_06790, partial [Planctomycetota bacterium]|nr:hypothetical protein [Planctomycetota bacterium]
MGISGKNGGETRIPAGGGRRRRDPAFRLSLALSLFFHAGLLAAFAFFPSPPRERPRLPLSLGEAALELAFAGGAVPAARAAEAPPPERRPRPEPPSPDNPGRSGEAETEAKPGPLAPENWPETVKTGEDGKAWKRSRPVPDRNPKPAEPELAELEPREPEEIPDSPAEPPPPERRPRPESPPPEHPGRSGEAETEAKPGPLAPENRPGTMETGKEGEAWKHSRPVPDRNPEPAEPELAELDPAEPEEAPDSPAPAPPPERRPRPESPPPDNPGRSGEAETEAKPGPLAPENRPGTMETGKEGKAWKHSRPVPNRNPEAAKPEVAELEAAESEEIPDSLGLAPVPLPAAGGKFLFPSALFPSPGKPGVLPEAGGEFAFAGGFPGQEGKAFHFRDLAVSPERRPGRQPSPQPEESPAGLPPPDSPALPLLPAGREGNRGIGEIRFVQIGVDSGDRPLPAQVIREFQLRLPSPPPKAVAADLPPSPP